MKTGGCEGCGVPYFLFYIYFWSLFLSLSFSLLCYDMVRPRDPVFFLVQKEIEFAIGHMQGIFVVLRQILYLGGQTSLRSGVGSNRIWLW